MAGRCRVRSPSRALRESGQIFVALDALGVEGIVVDKQLGHAERGETESIEAMRGIAGSETGRRHYTDMRSKLIDAAPSACAVRSLLDEAIGSSGPIASAAGSCAR